MGIEKQVQAFNHLFLAIIEENGYYEWLRHFMKLKGYNYADMASMLANEYEKCPDGMSPYYYMDSLEDAYHLMNENEINDIRDMVEFVYDNSLWKETY